jgi:hypothetical protein
MTDLPQQNQWVIGLRPRARITRKFFIMPRKSDLSYSDIPLGPRRTRSSRLESRCRQAAESTRIGDARLPIFAPDYLGRDRARGDAGGNNLVNLIAA